MNQPTIAVYRERCTAPDLSERQRLLDARLGGIPHIDAILYDGPDASRLGWTVGGKRHGSALADAGTVAYVERMAAQYATLPLDHLDAIRPG